MTAVQFLASAMRAVALCWQFAFELIVWASGAERRRAQREAEIERNLVLREASPTQASSDFSEYRPATIFAFKVTDRTGIAVGTLKFWFDQGSRVFRRDFTFINAAVRDAFGARNIPLKPIRLAPGDTVAALREASLQDIERILSKRLVSAGGGTAAAESLAVRSLPAPVAPTRIAPATPATPAPQPVAPAAAPQTPAASVRAPAARIRSVDEGIVLGSGVGSRRLAGTDGDGEKSREIRQFYLDLQLTSGDAPGVVKRIWGADLERALQEGNIRNDMLVRVSFFGRTQVNSGSEKKPAFKNLYEVTQIGARK